MFMSIINKNFKMSSDPSQENKYPPTTSNPPYQNSGNQNSQNSSNPLQDTNSYPPVHREEGNVQVPTLGV